MCPNTDEKRNTANSAMVNMKAKYEEQMRVLKISGDANLRLNASKPVKSSEMDVKILVTETTEIRLKRLEQLNDCSNAHNMLEGRSGTRFRA